MRVKVKKNTNDEIMCNSWHTAKNSASYLLRESKPSLSTKVKVINQIKVRFHEHLYKWHVCCLKLLRTRYSMKGPTICLKLNNPETSPRIFFINDKTLLYPISASIPLSYKNIKDFIPLSERILNTPFLFSQNTISHIHHAGESKQN